MVGTMVSVIAGGPSKKVSSGARDTGAFAADFFSIPPPLRFPRLTYS